MATTSDTALQALPIFVDGQWIAPRAQQTEDVINPAHAKPIARVPLCGEEDIEAAAQSALRAFPQWSKTPVVQRVQVLFRLKTLLEQHLRAACRR
jgi:malonate-semialdehyde dehydrogenase (acetylating) / methylmalonate-semialdehyde dehydrogenase